MVNPLKHIKALRRTVTRLNAGIANWAAKSAAQVFDWLLPGKAITVSSQMQIRQVGEWTLRRMLIAFVTPLGHTTYGLCSAGSGDFIANPLAFVQNLGVSLIAGDVWTLLICWWIGSSLTIPPLLLLQQGVTRRYGDHPPLLVRCLLLFARVLVFVASEGWLAMYWYLAHRNFWHFHHHTKYALTQVEGALPFASWGLVGWIGFIIIILILPILLLHLYLYLVARISSSQFTEQGEIGAERSYLIFALGGAYLLITCGVAWYFVALTVKVIFTG